MSWNMYFVVRETVFVFQCSLESGVRINKWFEWSDFFSFVPSKFVLASLHPSQSFQPISVGDFILRHMQPSQLLLKLSCSCNECPETLHASWRHSVFLSETRGRPGLLEGLCTLHWSRTAASPWWERSHGSALLHLLPTRSERQLWLLLAFLSPQEWPYQGQQSEFNYVDKQRFLHSTQS